MYYNTKIDSAGLKYNWVHKVLYEHETIYLMTLYLSAKKLYNMGLIWKLVHWSLGPFRVKLGQADFRCDIVLSKLRILPDVNCSLYWPF